MCFVSYSKKLFSAVHNFVHLNLAISLFIGYLVFAVGIELAGHDRVLTYMYIYIYIYIYYVNASSIVYIMHVASCIQFY